MIDPFIFSLIVFIITVTVLSFGIDKIYRSTKPGFFVNNRNANLWQASFSITAEGLYIFAVLITASTAVLKGPVATFWFIIPFFIVIASFGFLGNRLLANFPTGYTFSEYISYRYNDIKLTRFYQALHLFAAVYAVTVSLTGFGKIVDFLSKDLNYNFIVIGLGLSVLAYSAWGGIKSSLRNDSVLLWLIIVAILSNAVFAILSAGGLEHVYTVWQAAKPSSFLDISYAIDPGLLMLLLLSGGWLANNSQFQKVYALGNKNTVIKAYLIAATFMLIIYGALAFTAASSLSLGLSNPDPQLMVAHVIQSINGPIGILAFTLAVLCICGTTLDGGLNSAGSLVANDIFPKKNQVLTSRITMVVVALLGICMALFQFDIWFLITTFGVFRLIAVFPTIFGLLTQKKINSNILFYSMAVSALLAFCIIFYKFDVSKVLQGIMMLSIPAVAVLVQFFKRKA